MQLSTRDLETVTLVSKFGQLTAQQIRSLVFPTQQSHSPTNRSLRRLVDAHLLHRVERRLVGGDRGGSGVFVYGLGSEGHKLCKEGRWSPPRTVHPHTLAIVDVYVALRQLEQPGRLVIKGYLTEPDCHAEIGRQYLKPDLYVELQRPGSTHTLPLMFEIDMGSQGRPQITDKLVRYWKASQADEWEQNTLVVFVAIDDHRADELRWLLSKGDKSQQAIFRIRTIPQLVAELG